MLRPVLCSVVNSQDLDALLFHPVDGDIGQGRKQKLSGFCFASNTATVGGSPSRSR